MGKVLGVTGHRPEKLGGYGPNGLMVQSMPMYINLRQKTTVAVRDFILQGYDTFIQGMANGADREIFAEVVLELKKSCPHIKLVAAIPFKGQELRWSPAVQQHYKDILAQCDEIVYVSEPIVNPDSMDEVKAKMRARNIWMVEREDDLLAIWDGSGGGTGGCVRYAQIEATNKPKIHYINPKWCK
jgi:uncharacterized phage-like protein YoqJ